jgi:hypothetical protein
MHFISVFTELNLIADRTLAFVPPLRLQRKELYFAQVAGNAGGDSCQIHLNSVFFF